MGQCSLCKNGNVTRTSLIPVVQYIQVSREREQRESTFLGKGRARAPLVLNFEKMARQGTYWCLRLGYQTYVSKLLPKWKLLNSNIIDRQPRRDRYYRGALLWNCLLLIATDRTP